MSTLASSHITIDQDGVARIDDTRMKVVHLIKEKIARKASVEQLHEAYSHLSLAQIYAALAYYHDHQVELDAQIARELKEHETLRGQAPQTPGRQKLRDQGHPG